MFFRYFILACIIVSILGAIAGLIKIKREEKEKQRQEMLERWRKELKEALDEILWREGY